MKKEDWEEVYNQLNKIQYEFSIVYADYQKGKNKQIRERAEKTARYSLTRAEHLLKKHPEVYILLTGGENVTDYHRAIIYDEFTTLRYFERDLNELLGKIEAKIKD